MRGAIWIGLTPAVISLLWVQPTLADKRVALMIGNGAYENTTKLPNPPRDADALAELLRKVGFDVVQSRRDLGNLEFKRALRELNIAALNADIAVVFFAGHGIEINGANYLLPVDAKLKRDFDVEDEAVTLDRIIRAVEPAKKLRLVVLDACRENPFVRTVQRTAAIRSVVNGLGKVEPTTSDTLIAYAAKAGSYSDDGDGTNSPFTTSLLKHLVEPGLDIRLALGRVRDEVLKNTNNQQEPFVYGSLGGTSISLVPAPSSPKAPLPGEVRASYEMAERINTEAAWEAFLRTFRTGYHVDLARERLRLLQDAAAAKKKAEEEAAAKAQAEARAKAHQEEGRLAAEERAREAADAKRQAAAEAAKKAEEEALAKRQQEVRIAAERREAEERARREVEAKRQAAKAEEKSSIVVSALPPGAEAPATAKRADDTAAEQAKLVRALKTELKRVGCDPGNVDGVWDEKARGALAEFARIAKVVLQSDASTEALQAVLGQKGRVCPVQRSTDQAAPGGSARSGHKPTTSEHPKNTQATEQGSTGKRCQYRRNPTNSPNMPHQAYVCD